MVIPGHVAIIVQIAVTERDLARFGVNWLMAAGYRVTVIDAGRVVNPLVPQDRSHYPRLPGGFTLLEMAERGPWTAALAVLRSAEVVFNQAESGYLSPGNLPVLRLIGASRRPWVSFVSNVFPGWQRATGEKGGLWSKLRDAWFRWREIRLARSLISRLPIGWLGAPPAAFLVLGGAECHGGRLTGPGTRPIFAHASDYDTFLDIRAAAPAVRDIAVFIDEYVPYHRDLIEMGYDAPVDADSYFADLRRLFDQIEADLGLAVEIAVCPRADYSDKPGVYGNRALVEGATARLVAESRLVLAHRSTAIGYAILFGKPVLQIATRENYHHPSQRPYFDAFERILGKPILFHDGLTRVDLRRALDLDGECYRRYIRDFIKQDGSPDLSYWRIVAEELTKAGALSRPHKGDGNG